MTGTASIRAMVAVAAAAALLAPPARAVDPVPVRVRILKGSHQKPPKFDPKLQDLRRQLSRLSYGQWEQVSEQDVTMSQAKTEFVALPGGDHVAVTLIDVRGDTVTFEVALAPHNTQSKLTIGKGQRIVHQVTPEKGGSAFFVTMHAWP